MRILHVAGKIDPQLGGVGQAIRTMVKGLEDSGLDNELVTLDDPQSDFVKEETSLTLHTPGCGRGPWYYTPALIPWLQQNLRRFDIIIVHGLWQFHGYATQKIFRMENNRKKSRLFIMPHGMLDPYFQSAANRRLKAVRNWCYWKLIEKRMIQQAHAVLFTCLEEQRLAALSFKPYRPRRALVAGLGVQEPPAYSEKMRLAFLKKCPVAAQKHYLLFLGRIDEKKGVDLLLEAYRTELAAKTGDKKQLPILVIAGPGIETEYGKQIKQFVARCPLLQSSVVFPGMLTGDAKWGAFYCAEAFVLPSHQENFGIALVEAMACKTPVLISDKVNIWQEVINAKSGFVENDTVAGTRLLLGRWLKLNPLEKQLMSVKARQCFENKFSVHMAARQLLSVIGGDYCLQPINE